jgi:hypothetical protein
MPYPSMTKDLHHEMELVVAIGAGGVDISIGDALEHVWGYCAGLDMTRRDLQGEAKKTGRPWDMGKGFDLSAPMGAIMPKGAFDPSKGRIQLNVNGVQRQVSDLSKLIWSVPEVIANLSTLVRLMPGDLIMTARPRTSPPCSAATCWKASSRAWARCGRGSPDLHETVAQFRGDPGKVQVFRGAAARQGEASPGLPGVGLPWSNAFC